jgi:hypothetical protein
MNRLLLDVATLDEAALLVLEKRKPRFTGA